MTALALAVLKAMIVLPVCWFISYQNRHHKRSMWDSEEQLPEHHNEGNSKD
jgi:hypothetical protein